MLLRKAIPAAILAVLVFSSACALSQNPAKDLTAVEVMPRVITATGAVPPVGTVVTLKAGDPNTVVTGVVTMFMDTYSVLEQAVASHKYLIITHEPTFYNHLDDQAPFAGDPVQQQKLAYIRNHHLVVWRFHDTWHTRQPDGILAGMVEKFGWRAYQNSENPHRFTLPFTTVGKVAASLQARTGAHSIRIVGDLAMPVTNVGLLPGASSSEKQIKMLEEGDVQLLVAGESREWETVPYVQHRRRRPPQGAHPARPRRLRGSRHGSVRPLAADNSSRHARGLHPRRRAIPSDLEFHIPKAMIALRSRPTVPRCIHPDPLPLPRIIVGQVT